MNRISTPAALVAAIALAACGGRTTQPQELPAPPSIKSFEVDQAKINLGESVTLSWTVESADSVELFDDAGNKVDATVDGQSGTAQATPTRSTFYVLRARGEGGRDSAFVQVAVGEDLKEVFLVAVPPEVDAGEATLLLWSAHRARQVTLRSSVGQEFPLPAEAGSGTREVVPVRTTAYSLIASGVNPAETLTQTAEVKVRPVLDAFTLSRGAAEVGEDILVGWKTRGAGEVVVTEATFGELARATFPAQAALVDEGQATFTVPATLPGGEEVLEGQPLKFTFTVTQQNPAVTIVRQLHAHVGEAPAILELAAPAAVTEGKTFELSWVTRNAERLQLRANGALIHEPLPGQLAVVERGSIQVAAPPADTTYELRAWSHLGAQVSESRLVKVVKAPAIQTFTLPASVNGPGEVANAAWTTQNATRGIIRVKHGATVALVGAAQIGSGTDPIHPGQDATFVFEAYNDAGDVATAERDVTVLGGPPSLTAGPTPVTSGEEITVAWDFPAAIASTVIGDPTQPGVKNNPATDWLDLTLHTDAKELLFEDELNGVARLSLPVPFRFPFVNQLAEGYWVSVNGFVAFRATTGMPSNQSLQAGADLPPMVAPFWDDLELGAGKVLWVLEGSTFPRRLIVQWDKVRTSVDAQSELTFQVHLWETGEARFVYNALSGQDSAGEGASVGWRVAADLNEELAASGAAVLSSNDELTFFGAGGAVGGYAFNGERPGIVSTFARTPTGRYVPFSSRVNVIVPGSVVLNEAMVQPDATALEGQWLELFNATDEDIELGGTKLASLSTSTEWFVPMDTVLPAGGYLVLGQSTDTQVNGDAPVAVAWTDLVLDSAGDDTVNLSAGNVVGAMSYAGATLQAGESVQAPERAISSSGTPITCTRTKTFNAAGAVGTPGAANETCYDYTLTQVPVAYLDVSGFGTLLSFSSTDDARVEVSLAGAPFVYFGAPVTSLTVCTNGWMLSGTTSNNEYVNKTQPNTTAPVGTIAPFWDDLHQPTAGKVFLARIAAGQHPQVPQPHWVVQYHHYSHLSAGDDLNFQAKLFDDGAIEFHYAGMTSGSSSNYADGNSTTVWLEHPAGTSALPISINQPVVQPDTAFRFTPKQ